MGQYIPIGLFGAGAALRPSDEEEELEGLCAAHEADGSGYLCDYGLHRGRGGDAPQGVRGVPRRGQIRLEGRGGLAGDPAGHVQGTKHLEGRRGSQYGRSVRRDKTPSGRGDRQRRGADHDAAARLGAARRRRAAYPGARGRAARPRPLRRPSLGLSMVLLVRHREEQ